MRGHAPSVAALMALLAFGCAPTGGDRVDSGHYGDDAAVPPGTDAGPGFDGGPGFDAGPPPPGTDAGPGFDGGPGFDAGPPPPGMDSGPPPPEMDAGPPRPPGPGSSCMSDDDCGADGVCLPETASDGSDTGFVGGYCVAGCADTPCPDGSECFLLGADRVAVCLATCDRDGDCRLGYMCDADSTCWPGCDGSRGCPGRLMCSTDGICVGDGGGGGECSPSTPMGTCPGGMLCIDGACRAAPGCDADSHEPNDTRATATRVTLGTPMAGGRCAGDTDWWRIDVPAGQIVSVVLTFPDPRVANLDAYAYESDGSSLGGRVAGPDTTPSWVRAYETREESFGFISPRGAGTTTYYVKVTGATSSAAGSYTLAATAIEWTDGATCSGAGYSMLECTSGRRGSQTLISFPFPHPSDPYGVYMFDSLTNYRWLRRETMMAVRHAMREVDRRFARTNPLGLIDMCQRDGITPGYDVGDPRHPETTHDQGGNIDIAYYSTLSDNHARVICDASGGSTDGAFCTSAATTRHVVDLERQVYFMVMLARNPRLRVIGIDRVIAPLVLDHASSMVSRGVISSADRDLMRSRMAYGDGWPYHHHHIHVSMDWL